MKRIIERISSTAMLAVAFMLCASSAWAVVPVPTVVWDGDLAEGNTKRGSDGNNYTFTLNDANNTIQNGVLTIGAQAAFGARVSIGDSNATAVSVLIRYTDGVAPSQSEVPVALFCDCGSSTASPDVGVVSSGSTSRELWPCFGIASDDGGYYYSGIDGGAAKPQLPAGPGYLLFSYNLSKVNYATGSTGASLSGGSKSGVNQGSTGKITYVGVGGHTGLSHKANGSSGSNKYPPWRGLKIDGVAIFVGNAYTAADLADYVWPSGENYAKYQYGNKVLTWQTPSDAAGNGGDYIAYNGVAYNDFDIASGRDSGTTLNNGNTTSSSVYWKIFCFGQTGYTAPGYVLRLDGDYYKEVHGKFSPMTIGGLIVEPGATGYSFPSEGTRSAGLGDPTGETETWFDINEDFTIARSGGVAFMGDVNLDIAQGKTLSLGSNASVMKVAAVDTTAAPQLPYATELGGSLKLHGEGKLSINSGSGTLTAAGSTMDYSDLAATSSSADGAFVQGTLVVDVDTVFKFPEGATFPYFVAKSISGVINPSATMYIGGVAKEGGFLANANGSISYSAPVTPLSITTSGNQAWPAEWTDNAGNYVVNVGENVQTTFTLGATTPNSIVFNIEDGAVVTLSGTLTASQINVNGTGPLKTGAIICNASGNIGGTVIGDGTIIYDSIRPTTTGTDVVLTNPCWEGTVVVKGYNKAQTASGGDRQLFPQYWGSSNSKIKWNGVAGYFTDNINCPAAWVLEDLVENNTTYDALTKVDGSGSNNPISSPSLSGTGTFYDNSGPQAIFKFARLNNFTGVINIDTSGGMNVQFGATAIARETGKITILSGASVTIPNGSTWTARNGFSIKSTGTLTVDNTQSMKVASIVGTLDIAEGRTVTLTGDNDALNFGGSGTVNVHGTLNMAGVRWTVGASNEINLYEHGEISGNGPINGNIDLNNNNGTKTIHAYGNATISATIAARRDNQCEIIVEGGKTLTCSGLIFGTYAGSIAKRGAGTLKITNASSALPTREAGFIELATGTWNFGALRDFYGYTMTDGGDAVIKVVQNEEDYGKGLLEICNIDSSIEHVTVVKVDSTETTLNVLDGAASMGDGTAVVGGKACTYDWEFNGDLTSVGYSSNGLSYDGFNAANSFEDSSRLYIRTHPYYDSTYTHGLWTWADDWTVAIKCTVPTTTKGMVITFGNQGNGCVGLATSENDGKVILFKAGANGAAETISEMAVSGRSTAQHLYIFSKTSDGKMKVYCDDTLIDDKSVSGIGSLKGTLQVGSLHGGVDYINLNRPANDDPATIDFVQVYNYGISDAQRSALISNYAWVNPNQYTRTVSGDESLSSSDAWTKSSDSSTVALPVTDADAIVTTSSSSAALTVNADFEADTLTINSGTDGAALRIKAGTGTLSAAKVVVNAPVTVEYGAVDFSSSVVTFGEGGSLTYDFSGEAINSRTTRLVAKLTGLVEAPADPSDSSTWPVQVITHSDAASLNDCYESTFSYDDDDSAYHYVCGPDHNWGSEVYYAGGYWSSTAGENPFTVVNSSGVTTKVFSGDTVVIPADYPGDTPVIYSDTTLPANVSNIRVSKSKIKMCSRVDSGDIFTGSTWTIDSGCILWFGVANNHPTSLGAMTINGSGTVECGNITINGAISGNAPVKILDNVTTRLTSTGSIATTHTISGGSTATIAVAKTTPISDRMSFGTWTGTVTLPENFNANSAGVDLHYYGKDGSTVEINGFTGWLKTGETYSGAGTYGRQPKPHLKLNGAMAITALSSAYYDLKGGISGSGNFSLSSANKPSGDCFWISKVSDYTGTIINNTTGSAETTIVITELVADSFVGGAKLLSRGGVGPLSIGKVTVDETEQSLSDLCYESDGVYVAAAEYNSVKYYSVAAAIAVASDENLADITLLNGCTTVPARYYINGGVIAKYNATVVNYNTSEVTPYGSVEDAINSLTPAEANYKYVVVYEDDTTVSLAGKTVMIQLAPGVTTFTMNTPNGGMRYSRTLVPQTDGIYLYAEEDAPATFTWNSANSSGSWGIASNWLVSGNVPARYPRGGIDEVVFTSDAVVTLGGDVSVSAVRVSADVTFTATDLVIQEDGSTTLTVGEDGIVLTDAGATVTVVNVNIPTPTTSVGGGAKVLRVGNTYKVVYGTIFSVY